MEQGQLSDKKSIGKRKIQSTVRPNEVNLRAYFDIVQDILELKLWSYVSVICSLLKTPVMSALLRCGEVAIERHWLANLSGFLCTCNRLPIFAAQTNNLPAENMAVNSLKQITTLGTRCYVWNNFGFQTGDSRVVLLSKIGNIQSVVMSGRQYSVTNLVINLRP